MRLWPSGCRVGPSIVREPQGRVNRLAIFSDLEIQFSVCAGHRRHRLACLDALAFLNQKAADAHQQYMVPGADVQNDKITDRSPRPREGDLASNGAVTIARSAVEILNPSNFPPSGLGPPKRPITFPTTGVRRAPFTAENAFDGE